MGFKRDLFCQVLLCLKPCILLNVYIEPFLMAALFIVSPINDLLDKGVFSLENLLEEDELIQEVKAKNELLIELSVLFHLLFE